MKKIIKTDNNGITLIALVVTIIVLIILAGVTLILVFGQDGMINKAKDASTRTGISAVVEKLTFMVEEAEVKALMENKDRWDATNEILDEKAASDPNISVNKPDENTIEVTIDGRTVAVVRDDETGEIKIISSEDELDDSKKKLALTAYSGIISYPEGGTVQIKKNETGGTITVESDNPNVVNATYDPETGVITITCGDQLGEATITVKSSATEEFEEQTAEYKVTVVKGENDLALSSYGPDQIKPSRTRNVIVTKNASEGAISITSTNSNRAIGTYDEVNKKIIVTTGTEQGEATLTITTAETALYKSKTVEYKVEVSETAPPVLVASNITSQNVQGSYYDSHKTYHSGYYSNSKCSTCSGSRTSLFC